MRFSETLQLAIDAIRAHKLRSFLTLLGMIIGVACFMIILSALLGFNAYVDEKIAGIGSNTFTIQRFNFNDFKDTDSIAEAQRRNKELTLDDLDFIRARMQVIDRIGAKAGGNGRSVKAGSNTMDDVQINGTEAVIGEIEKVDVKEGRYFSQTENDSASRVAFIGTDVADKLFPGQSPINQELTISGIPYRVIGVRTAKGSVFGMPQDAFITLPLKTFGLNFGGFRGSRYLYFVGSAASDSLFADAADEARYLMRIRRQLTSGDKDTFAVVTPDAISSLRDSVLGPVMTVILIVPTIALVVGAIVIMNIMLVAVTERTREIGIRKSLGARQADILKQFLAEAALLSAVGGSIGIVIAYIAGIIITKFIIPTTIPWYAAAIAVAVSAAVGILAGLFPAWKAARLDPIEALRAD